MLRRGDTFRVKDDWHVCVVLSDPSKNPDAVYVVNFTHWERNRDQSCVLNPSDHGTISKQTIIHYNNPTLESAAAIERKIKSKHYESGLSVRRDVLDRITEGACKSKMVPERCKVLLRAQGLMPSVQPQPPTQKS